MTVKKNTNKLIVISIIVLSVIFVLTASIYVYQTWFAGKNSNPWNKSGDMADVSVSSVPGWNPGSEFTPDSTPSPLEFHSFSVDTPDILAGAKVDVTFEAEVFAENKPGSKDIAVKDVRGNVLGYMNDDGTEGDRKANDGIYTLVAPVGSGNTASSIYFAEAKVNSQSITSDAIEVFSYTDITATDFAAYREIVQKLASFTASSDATQYLYHNPYVAKMTVDNNGKSIRFLLKSGITCVWTDDASGEQPSKGGSGKMELYSDYSEVKTRLSGKKAYPANSDGDVCVIRPFRNSDFAYDDYKQAGKLVADAHKSKLVVCDNEKANLDAFKKFDEFGLILIDSHGITDYDNNPAIVTGISYTAAESIDSCDWQSRRVCTVISTQYGARLALGGKFFDRYYPVHSLDETIVYLGTCHGLSNTTLADAFLRKGAFGVYGFDGKVSVAYSNDVLKETIVSSQLIDFLSVSDTMERCKTVTGIKDPSYTSTEFKYQGDASALLSTDRTRGKVKGRVSDITTDKAVKNITVRVYSKDGNLRKTLRIKESSAYTISLVSGTYYFRFSSPGYKTLTMEVEAEGGKTVYVPNAQMTSVYNEASALVEGTVINATTGNPVSGIRISLYNGWNRRSLDGAVEVVSVTSDSDGRYKIAAPVGYYTLSVHGNNFINSFTNVLSGIENIGEQNVSVVPALPESADQNGFRVVLSWEKSPKDLDAHLTGPKESGSRFHLYYRNGGAVADSSASQYYRLDLDNTNITSYPAIPETVTVEKYVEGVYRFSVYDFENSSKKASNALAKSGARVDVYNCNSLVKTFYVPYDGKGCIWNVFELKSGSFNALNKFRNGSESNINNF